MRLEWSNESMEDVERLYEFLRPVAPAAAHRALISPYRSHARLIFCVNAAERIIWQVVEGQNK